MSPMTKVLGAPLRTLWQARMQSSMVTGTVPWYPMTIMPMESPTRIMSMPACSAKDAMG